MKSIKPLNRLLYINYILAKNGLDQVLFSLWIFAPFKIVSLLNPWNWFRQPKLTRGEAIRKTLEELGPIFIKFGQALSTRPDILPIDIARELCKLQDRVPPFPGEEALAIVETAFNQPISELFACFDLQVLASASMAQVHAAKLKSGEDVVVKILRPNIRKIIKQDLQILHTLAQWCESYWSKSKRFRPKEIVKEFERTLMGELDLQREAANAGQLRRNFHNSPLLYVPEVHWNYIRDNILVMERIYGIPVTDVAALYAHGVDVQKLAERGMDIFFTQVFRDCFFHADMHPGNILVSFERPQNPQYICVDFGIIGTLNDEDKRYLAENLLAFFNRDYRRVAKLHLESGWLPSQTRLDEFESAVRTVCEPIFEKPLKDISFALIVLQLFQVARRFHMEIQPQLILLQKTLMAVEGLGRQLYPDLDLWSATKPHLEKWLHEQIGPKALLQNLRDNWPFYVEQLPAMPRLLHDVLQLKKENLQRELIGKECRKTVGSLRTWCLGFGAGMLFPTLAFGGVYYFQWLPPEKIIAMTAIIAAFGGIMTIFHLKKRN